MLPDYDHRMHLFPVPYSQHAVQLYGPVLFYPNLFNQLKMPLGNADGSIQNFTESFAYFKLKMNTWWSTEHRNFLNRSSMGINVSF